MKLKHNKYDIVIYIMALILVVVILIISNSVVSSAEKEKKYAIVTIEGKQKYKLDMDKDTELVLRQDKYPCLLDDMIIEIKDKKVRVKKEESPLNYCSLQGWISGVGKPIVCLPNEVIITIIGQDVADSDWEM